MNRNIKIPVLQISETEFFSESNTILNYLAEDSDFLPKNALARVKILRF